MAHLFGHSVVIAIFGGMLWANARRWRSLAKSYATSRESAHLIGTSIEKRNMLNAVLVSSSGFNSLKGILTIEAHSNGIAMRVMPVFAWFHRPLFVPFSDISGWETTWYLDAPSAELTFRNAPDVKIIMPAEQAQWIRSFAGPEMVLQATSHPRGKAGQGWRAFVVANAAFGVVAVAWVSFMLLTGHRF